MVTCECDHLDSFAAFYSKNYISNKLNWTALIEPLNFVNEGLSEEDIVAVVEG